MDSSQQPTNAFEDTNPSSSEAPMESEAPEMESEAPQTEAEQVQPPEPNFAPETTASEPMSASSSFDPVPPPEPPVFDDSDLDSPWDEPELTTMPPPQPAVQSDNLPLSDAQVPAKSMNFGLLINRIIAIAIFLYGVIAVISLLNG